MSKIVLDSCIFVEAWTEGEFVETCSGFIRKYMNDQRATCYIPIIVPGEVIKNVLSKTSDKDRIISILREYRGSFLNHNINFIDIDKKVLDIRSKLEEIRVQEHDKFIITCSIASGCTEIITLDKDMYKEREHIASISKDVCGHEIKINNPKFSKGILQRLRKFRKKRKK